MNARKTLPILRTSLLAFPVPDKNMAQKVYCLMCYILVYKLAVIY